MKTLTIPKKVRVKGKMKVKTRIHKRAREIVIKRLRMMMMTNKMRTNILKSIILKNIVLKSIILKTKKKAMILKRNPKISKSWKKAIMKRTKRMRKKAWMRLKMRRKTRRMKRKKKKRRIRSRKRRSIPKNIIERNSQTYEIVKWDQRGRCDKFFNRN